MPDKQLDDELALMEIAALLFPGETETNAAIVERVRELVAFWQQTKSRRGE
jgi:hypothetical protein